MEATVTTSKYVRDFESLFVPIRKEQLRDKARSGNLRHCQFRSLCWRYFLHCLPEQYDQWLDSCIKSREKYEQIKVKHFQAKQVGTSSQQSAILSSATPPSQSASTTSNKSSSGHYSSGHKPQALTDLKSKLEKHSAYSLAKNKELEEEQQFLKATANQCDYKNILRTIERDVVRTFPDMEFFRQTEMQGILEDVLFNFASENLHLSYKQGMHELLATVLYVLHTDSQNCLINYEGGYANETIATLLDLKYLEHDVFHLFSSLMKSIETWYQNDEILMVPDVTPFKRENGGFTSKLGKQQQVSSVLGIKLRTISEKIVKNYDLELFNHLEALQIAPQIYGIRWMRLLFGREFEFLDLLTVWDAIICDQISMSLTDYIFASMLITIRQELVNGDYTDCLNNLMRHQFKDVQYVIKLALHLRDPQNYSRPKSLQTVIQNYNRTEALRNKYLPKSSLTSKLSQQYNSGKQQILLAVNPIKEYEMREIQSSGSSCSANKQRGQNAKFPIGTISGGGGSSGSRNALNLSTESYDDLPSIVDYCWRLLSEQIDSLQRCLPKEKCLYSEDEIFVALAQLKKVRDVLKGSLRLEDELESAPEVKFERK